VSRLLPVPPPRRALDGHKGSSGRLLVLAGSGLMPGAALLVARAAQRSGAGLVRVLDRDGTFAVLLPLAAPEAVRLVVAAEALDGAWFEAREEHALVIGPGLGTELASGQGLASLQAVILSALQHFPGPVLLDADGLNAFAGAPERLRRPQRPLVLTPHPLEAARLIGSAVGSSRAERTQAAQALARATGGVCLLKGADTVLAEGTRLAFNHTGSPALSTAGSGDVLSGLLGAYLCCLSGDFDAFAAACSAAWVHGRAGELCAARFGERGTIASDLVPALPEALLELDPPRR
jgi:hydroxyethylthiazole kinase-like uncharacterized protein yjeF